VTAPVREATATGPPGACGRPRLRVPLRPGGQWLDVCRTADGEVALGVQGRGRTGGGDGLTVGAVDDIAQRRTPRMS
jgi:hypothetical protein